MISIRTLGTVAVEVDGGPAPPELLWRKHLSLLIYLTRSPRLTRTRQHLLGLFWSDKAEAAARHSLNEALRIIRKVGGPDAVISAVDRVTLRAGLVSLDVDALDSDPGSVDPGEAGEFLEGFSLPDATGFEEWLAAERRHWRGRIVATLLDAVTAAGDAGRIETAIRLAERAARLDPESEPATRALIECLARAGDRAAALGCLQRFERVLAERFGTRPSPDLLALAERLRRSGGRGSRRDPIAPPEPDGRRRAPLFGREEAVTDLLACWERARRGDAAVAVIRADEGLGKSRLLADFATQVGVGGATVTMARIVESDQSRSDGALAGLVRDGLIDAPGVGGAAAGSLAAAARVDPTWADRFPAARTAQPSPLPDALLDILDATAREAPVLVAIDDAHWADAESLAAVERILRDHRRLPIMIVLTATEQPAREELDRIRSRIGHDFPGSSLGLAPLDAGALAALVSWTFPRYQPAAAERIARRLEADTAGYPLLAIDLIDAIAAGLELVGPAATPWPRPAATLSHTRPGELPDTIVAAIRVGFRRLGADARLALAGASLGPGRLEPDQLGRVVGLAPDRIDRALDELEWHRWLAADARGYTFVARISREVVSRDFVTGSQRRRWSAAWEAVA